jgi:uncharacterized protein (TIGR00661 family)
MTMNERKLRVLYGVHGYGRGHAARALAVLPELTRQYDVRILAGDDAYDQLSREYDVLRIPVLRYYQGRDGKKRSPWRTIVRNTPAVLDLQLQGPISYLVEDEMRRFAPDVLVSDSEGWTHRAAKRLGIPRVSFDHYGILVHCALPMSRWDRATLRLESIAYRRLVADPDRVIVAAFFPGRPKRPGVRVVGPILRDMVRDITPTRGEHLLVYFTNAREHYTPTVEQALAAGGVPVKVYGPPRDDRDGNIQYCPISNEQFVRDLASCRGVFSTSGNQLISEAIHLGKPILTVPEEALEQRLNANFVRDWGIGMQTTKTEISPELLQRFLAREQDFLPNFAAHQHHGRSDAVDALRDAIEELAGQRRKKS